MKNRRRDFFKTAMALTAGLGVGGAVFPNRLAAEQTANSPRYSRDKVSFNTSCIRNRNLPIEEELKVAAEAGFRAVEVWTQRISVYLEGGGKLSDLKKRADDLGLTVVNGIGFATWIMNEADKRDEGLETMRREMEWLAELGCRYVAAPAAGPWKERIDGIENRAERFRAVMELGDASGVHPMLELWGTSPTFSKLSEIVAVALATGRSDAYLLLDAYHLYRGGNSFDSLNLLNGRALPVFHLNDYPSDPVDNLTDKDRVFPGDGVCPTTDLLRRLRSIGFDGYLSLELFNPGYQERMEPLTLAKVGYEKMAHVLDAAGI